MIEAMLRTALMADQRLQALMDDPRPAFVWHLDGRALAWANRAAAQSLGLAPADILRQQSSSALVSLSPQIAAIARKLPRPGAMRLDRLRLPGMGALDTLSCACRSFDGPEGFLGLLVQSLDLPRGRRQQSWAPPSVTDTLPPLPAAGTEAIPSGESAAAKPFEQNGAWRWVEAEGERSEPARPDAPLSSPVEPAHNKPAEPLPIARTKPLRFVFQTDAEGRFVSVSAELAQALGQRAADWTGRRFADIAAAHGLRDSTAIVSALAGRQTWTGLSVLWPDAATRQETPISLSASPQFQGEGQFAGFRGFGIAGMPRALSTPIEAEVPPAKAAVVWQDAEPADGQEPAPAPEPLSVRTPPRNADSNVVRLPSKVTQEKHAPERPVSEKHISERSGPERHSLTATERTAFHEIAKALGARIEGERRVEPAKQEAPPAAEPDHAGLEQPVAHAEPETRLEKPGAVIALAQPDPKPADPAVAPALSADEIRWLEDAASEPEAVSPETLPAGEPEPVARPIKLGRLDKVPVALIDRLPIGIFIARGEELQFANRTMLELLGYPDVEAIRQVGGLDHVFAGSGPVATGEDANPGVLLKTASGETIAVDGRVQTTHWDGESALLISVRRPLGEVGADKLHAAERRADELQAVLDTATDGVVILDEQGRIVSINRSAEALFGYEQREIIGKDLLLLFAPESHRAAFDYLDSLRSNGVASLLNDGREVIGRVRQGGAVPLFMTIGRLGSEKTGEEAKRFCAVLRDVTSFKKAESELTAAKRQAEEASSQKSDFLAKISHEVRTPLNAIIGFAEVMMEERFGPMGNERYRSYARDIHTSGEHVISLVNDLLDLSKIEAGKLDLSFSSVNLNEVVQQSVSLMQPQASRDRIIIRMALAGNLPNVVADGRSIRQIVLNLLSNSIKFTQAGGQAIISTTLSERGEAVLRVRDTGVGMTERELTIAMEPFRQVASTTLGGTGLGLPLTKALVEANRASFTIQSTKNSGTLVEVTFPSTRVLAE
ncbi:PAS domain-containing protein [Labrys sp. KB_33_2]|uniref:PAS domain-containing sensor histidine kinase n=1 Tax=Labrys sp. KB_33_2 TaxID=3237479 RepID=UPI003F93DE4A